MKLTLAYPPQFNHLYTISRGRKVLSAKGRDYKTLCGWQAKTQGARPQVGFLTVRMDIYRPRRIGDIDNVFKACFDALTGIAWDDDSQVVEVHAYRHDDKRNPRVELTIAAVEATE